MLEALLKMIISVVVDLVVALAIMVLLAVAHGLDAKVPTLSYWAIFILLIIADFIRFSGSVSDAMAEA